MNDNDSFMWIESYHAKPDSDEEAIRRWVAEHWKNHLRPRWIEHLEGILFWTDLDRSDFGILSRDFVGDRDLLKEVARQLKAGKENLDVVCWAEESGANLEAVVRILEAFDINARRLWARFESGTAEPPDLPNPDVIIDENDPEKKD